MDLAIQPIKKDETSALIAKYEQKSTHLSLNAKWISKKRTVIIIDPEDIGMTAIESEFDQIDLIPASSLQKALEMVGRRLIDGIILGITPDEIQKIRDIRKEKRVDSIPIIVLLNGGGVTDRGMCFEMGADDIIQHPIDPHEVFWRLKRFVIKQEDIRTERIMRKSHLVGSTDLFTMGDLVRYLDEGKKTGILALTSQNGSGKVVLLQGRMIDAEFGGISGDDAILTILEQNRLTFDFVQSEVDINKPKTITMSTMGILMEYARRKDEKSRAGTIEIQEMYNDIKPEDIVMQKTSVWSSDQRDIFMDLISEGKITGDIIYYQSKTLLEPPHPLNHRILLFGNMNEIFPLLMGLSKPITSQIITEIASQQDGFIGCKIGPEAGPYIDLLVVPFDKTDKTKKISSVWGYMIAPSDGDGLQWDINSRLALKKIIPFHHPHLIVAIGDSTLMDPVTDCTKGMLSDVTRYPNAISDGPHVLLGSIGRCLLHE